MEICKNISIRICIGYPKKGELGPGGEMVRDMSLYTFGTFRI